jgi:hypothetical protein
MHSSTYVVKYRIIFFSFAIAGEGARNHTYATGTKIGNRHS